MVAPENQMALSRLFFATDIHGSEKTYMKFLNAASFYKSQILILGGDITGKMIVPLIKESNGFKANFRGVNREAKDEAQAQSLELEIRQMGGYPYRTNPDEMRELQADESKVHALFVQLMLDTVRSWVKLAEERLAPLGVKMYMTGGNDDLSEIKPIIHESDFVIDPEDKVVDLDGKHEMASLGWSNLTPWNTPRECSEEELAQKIEKMTSQVKNMKTCVFNFHVPPIDTVISECPALDKDLKPIMIGSELQMTSGGSSSVSKAIEQNQPLLGLHGHIHESKGSVKIGRTLCLNPGSEYAEGILRGAMVNLEDEKVKSYLLTSG
jgi:Icc-related predicted phosphoesterase